MRIFSSTNQKVGSLIPVAPILHAQVTLYQYWNLILKIIAPDLYAINILMMWCVVIKTVYHLHLIIIIVTLLVWPLSKQCYKVLHKIHGYPCTQNIGHNICMLCKEETLYILRFVIILFSVILSAVRLFFFTGRKWKWCPAALFSASKAYN